MKKVKHNNRKGLNVKVTIRKRQSVVAAMQSSDSSPQCANSKDSKN